MAHLIEHSVNGTSFRHRWVQKLKQGSQDIYLCVGFILKWPLFTCWQRWPQKLYGFTDLTASDSSEKRTPEENPWLDSVWPSLCCVPISRLNNMDKGMRHSNWLAWANVPSPMSRESYMTDNPIRKALSFSGSFRKEKIGK